MFYFLNKQFWTQPWLVALFISSLTVVIFGRYLLTSLLYRYILNRISHSLRNSLTKHFHQIKGEIKWAFFSSLVFAILGTLCLLAFQHDLTAIYTRITDYSLLYFFMSPLLILSLYETYYYWLHRWMHTPTVFRIVHRVHHDSLKPTVFTAFSFHPVEAFLQFLFFPLALLFIPMHLSMVALVFTVLTFCAVVNHSGFEIYATRLRRHLIGSAHHDLHHQEFRTNFGLNFTWWDKVMKTESNKF